MAFGAKTEQSLRPSWDEQGSSLLTSLSSFSAITPSEPSTDELDRKPEDKDIFDVIHAVQPPIAQSSRSGGVDLEEQKEDTQMPTTVTEIIVTWHNGF